MGVMIQWPVLGGLRFFLAWVVLCSHLRHSVPAGDLLMSFQNFNNFSAVLGFLLISGFSIAHSVSKATEGFYRRRFIRVYPLYLAAIIISIIPFFLVGSPITSLDSTQYSQPTLTNLIGNLIFLQGFIVFPLGSNSVVWTLSVEIFCYLLAPVFIKLNSKIILSLIGISAGAYILFSQLKPPDANIAFLRYGLPLILLLWAWLLGFFYFLNAEKPLAKALMIGLGCLLLEFHSGRIGDFDSFTYVISALVLIYSGSIQLSEPILRAFNYLGDLSYPLYLFHSPAILFGYAVLGLRTSWSLVLLSLISSIFFYHLIDQPVRSKKNQKLA